MTFSIDDRVLALAGIAQALQQVRRIAGLEVTGDTDALPSLLAALDRPDPNFNIVTP